MAKITAAWHDPQLAHPFLQFNCQSTFFMPSKKKKKKIIELLWRSDCSCTANVIFAVCVLPHHNNQRESKCNHES